jgi:hypothetical protein
MSSHTYQDGEGKGRTVINKDYRPPDGIPRDKINRGHHIVPDETGHKRIAPKKVKEQPQIPKHTPNKTSLF